MKRSEWADAWYQQALHNVEVARAMQQAAAFVRFAMRDGIRIV